jgi:methylenetetrahydrofolate dehydrogenase (NADP+)/methenyltetrahydrofolate cyclohydrolase
MQIIDGRKIKEDILSEVKESVAKLSFAPVFCDILVGDDVVSASYVRIKEKNALNVGIKFRTAEFPETVTTEELIYEIENLNKVPHMCGIIVQLPLPSHIDRQRVLDAIDPSLDVDCLGSLASSNFYNDTGELGYPTALACLKILDSLNMDLTDKKIVMLGQGVLVGLPVSHLIRSRGLNLLTINNQTENIKEILKDADVIISGIGKGKFITREMIKKDVIIIDAGTSEESGSIVGDVDMNSVMDVASYMTPSPGGVGPVTVAMLLSNVLKVALNKKIR